MRDGGPIFGPRPTVDNSLVAWAAIYRLFTGPLYVNWNISYTGIAKFHVIHPVDNLHVIHTCNTFPIKHVKNDKMLSTILTKLSYLMNIMIPKQIMDRQCRCSPVQCPTYMLGAQAQTLTWRTSINNCPRFLPGFCLLLPLHCPLFRLSVKFRPVFPFTLRQRHSL